MACGVWSEPDIGIVVAGIERMRNILVHLSRLAADGYAWEAELARRGVLDELALEIGWIEGTTLPTSWISPAMKLDLRGDGAVVRCFRRRTQDSWRG